MRLSADPQSPDFAPSAHLARVYLDGELLTCCFLADEEAGEAHCYKTDAYGRVVGPAEREVKRGIVRIEVPA